MGDKLDNHNKCNLVVENGHRRAKNLKMAFCYLKQPRTRVVGLVARKVYLKFEKGILQLLTKVI